MCFSACTNGKPANYPSVILETGKSQSDADLMRVTDLWINGTNGAVKVVMLCKIFGPHVNNKITAKFSLCRLLPGPKKEILRTTWVKPAFFFAMFW